jgi:putative tryptophan/tyrosine transport system substrate-binding protein
LAGDPGHTPLARDVVTSWSPSWSDPWGPTMRRREFITLLSGAALARPLAARAQQGNSPRRVGVLMGGEDTDVELKALLAVFVQGLRSHGWIDGQNLYIDVRWTGGGGGERERASATDLLRLSPDVIYAVTTPSLTALLRQGPVMPIVFVQVSDPVAQGFVSNLAHPGGNITGFSAYEFSIGGKWIDLLQHVVPALARVAVIFNPDTSPQSKFLLDSIEAAAPSLHVEAAGVPFRNVAELERAIQGMSGQANSGLIIPTDGFLQAHRQLVVELAARHRVPAIYHSRLFTDIGGLMSYGIEYESIFRQAAVYVDRILKGTKAGDLPVQAPTKFSFVINLKTAKTLGIEVPTTVLLSADDYIE